MASFPHTGYFIFGDGEGNALLLDGGDLGPDEVPAHGHCNTFGYELSLAGRRVIVDSGVETYEPGPWRDYYRSTRAHNTVMVDGEEQSEIWAAFRVARQARLQEVAWKIGPEFAYFEGAHDGFARRFPGLRHRRLVAQVPGAFWLVADYVWGAAGEHWLESFLHLHPDVVLGDRAGELEEQIILQGPDGLLLGQLLPFGFTGRSLSQGDEDPPQGWYAPRFGERLANRVNIWRWQGKLPHVCGYAMLLPGAGPPQMQVQRTGTGEVYRICRTPRIYEIRHENRKIELTVKEGT